MFHVPVEQVKRISFASKLFPRLRAAVNLDKGTKTHQDRENSYDGESFARGRSKNKDLLTFFGAIADPSNGCASFIHLPIFRRSIKKLSHLVESELEFLGAQEVLMPTLVPEELWHTSRRLTRQPDALEHVYKFNDKAGTQLLLGPTFEETITCLLANTDLTPNESDLPLMLYQTSNKFRFESNPKYGLIRSNEFLMNDLYTFDATLEQAQETYATVARAYGTIFERLGLDCLKIESQTGGIGGKYSHEFQLIVQSGQDHVIACRKCNHAFNSEMLKNNLERSCIQCGSKDIKREQSLELGHIFLLSDVYSRPLRATYSHAGPPTSRRFYEMGCFGLGLTRIVAAGVDLLSITPTSECYDNHIQLRWPSEVEPYNVAIVTPARRSKQYQAGSSEFIQRLLVNILEANRKIDVIIEDKDKDGIGKRLQRIQSLGIPNIIVIGNRFLQDTPEVELQTLDPKKENYDLSWHSEDSLIDYIKNLKVF